MTYHLLTLSPCPPCDFEKLIRLSLRINLNQANHIHPPTPKCHSHLSLSYNRILLSHLSLISISQFSKEHSLHLHHSLSNSAKITLSFLQSDFITFHDHLSSSSPVNTLFSVLLISLPRLSHKHSLLRFHHFLKHLLFPISSLPKNVLSPTWYKVNRPIPSPCSSSKKRFHSHTQTLRYTQPSLSYLFLWYRLTYWILALSSSSSQLHHE